MNTQTPTVTDEAKTPLRRGRVGRLDTVNRVRREMVRIYRDMKAGKIQPNVGTKLVFVLIAVQKAIEFSSTEQRLDRLEEAVQGRALSGREPPFDVASRLAAVKRERLTFNG